MTQCRAFTSSNDLASACPRAPKSRLRADRFCALETSPVFQGRKDTGDFGEMALVCSARLLLGDTDKSSQPVAPSCGFANPDVMRRAFPRRIGTGPSEYREPFRGQRRMISGDRASFPPCR